jgi:hypothetical protein
VEDVEGSVASLVSSPFVSLQVVELASSEPSSVRPDDACVTMPFPVVRVLCTFWLRRRCWRARCPENIATRCDDVLALRWARGYRYPRSPNSGARGVHALAAAAAAEG